MNKILVVTTSIFGLMAIQGLPARADEALDKLAKDPKQWVMQQGDDANTRYSKLNQINASNAKKLQVAWTFSTG
ncbi:MAG: lanthanide-dependent methanol dehydrogenase, partial [Bradyrhizobium sp.]|nr:lanthanide-dependent methanol dehydrogenase [Bradyrhizobium sp.]